MKGDTINRSTTQLRDGVQAAAWGSVERDETRREAQVRKFERQRATQTGTHKCGAREAPRITREPGIDTGSAHGQDAPIRGCSANDAQPNNGMPVADPIHTFWHSGHSCLAPLSLPSSASSSTSSGTGSPAGSNTTSSDMSGVFRSPRKFQAISGPLPVCGLIAAAL